MHKEMVVLEVLQRVSDIWRLNMARQKTRSELEMRRHILSGRKDKENLNIIHKIERNIRKFDK